MAPAKWCPQLRAVSESFFCQEPDERAGIKRGQVKVSEGLCWDQQGGWPLLSPCRSLLSPPGVWTPP